MDDLISRQAAIDALRKMQTYKLGAGDNLLLIDQAEAQTELMMLPSAEPQRKRGDLHLRSQVERLTIAETLLSRLWEEIRLGCAQDGLLQIAAYCQTDINRIVWKLNEIANKEDE